MAWVAVDKDGTEKIFSSYPERRSMFHRNPIFIGFLPILNCYTKNQRNKWAAHWSTDENDPLPEGAIVLPKGSIQKLIERNLTWKDEPVELTEGKGEKKRR